MNRRRFLGTILFGMGTSSIAEASLQKFTFKIKTKSGGIVGNVLIEAGDVEAAKVKLFKRYPGCQILSVSVK
ncbi:hypothetical protein [Planctomicrobium sp. SH527]|uniref:hypothetical protein n=1 Tax=Planctomicrobium sp. SH527 TaxID=3448123 RepID=UPI003F5CB3FF